MRFVHRSLVVGIAAAAILGIASAPAGAATIHVSPGESIQAAVNRAHPGDEIVVHSGVYHESVQIKKNHLTLRGAGATGDATEIKPQDRTKRCEHGLIGICVVQHRNRDGDRVVTAGTRISGFLVRGFGGFGAGAFAAKDTVFRDNIFVKNAEYGAAAFGSTGTQFLHNLATDAGEAGFYIGDSPHADALLRGNRARHNGAFGYFLRDASGGVLVDNTAIHNCLGIGLVDTGSPGAARGWKVKGNDALRNQRLCPASDEGPAISGTGIGLLGARGNVIQNNLVVANRPADPSAFAPGGIVLLSSEPLGGGNAANNTIRRNWAFRNAPDDISWDGKGKGNKFLGNRCDTSEPAGLCH